MGGGHDVGRIIADARGQAHGCIGLQAGDLQHHPLPHRVSAFRVLKLIESRDRLGPKFSRSHLIADRVIQAVGTPSRHDRSGAPGGFFDWDPPQTIRRVLRESDLDQLRGEMTSGKWDEIVLILAHTDFADPSGFTDRLLREEWTATGDAQLRLVRVVRFMRPQGGE